MMNTKVGINKETIKFFPKCLDKIEIADYIRPYNATFLLSCIGENEFKLVTDNPNEGFDSHYLEELWINTTKERKKELSKGIKESKGKLNYELDFDFITQMAEKMSLNKSKYEPYNWKKPIDIKLLKQSLFRHVIEIMKNNYEDDNRELGHVESAALNCMMLNYQLKNENKSK